MSDFTITETDDGFRLRRDNVEISLTKEECLGLKETLDTWAQRSMSTFLVGSRQVHSRVPVPITEAVVWPDAMNEALLIELSTPSGHATLYSFPKEKALDLSLVIPHVLAQMERGPSS